MSHARTHVIGTALVPAILLAASAHAGGRRFSFTYEATTLEEGAVEYVQWVTWSNGKDSNASYDRIDFRHQLEFSLNDVTTLGVHLSDWQYHDGVGVMNGTEWRNAAFEVIHQLRDPATDDFGLALFGEVKTGPELVAVEGRLILQRACGEWTFAWNGLVEAEWEGEHFDHDNGLFGQTLGASYHLSHDLLIGAELVHEIEFHDWSEWEDHVIYLGPVASIHREEWWLTVTPLVQVTSVEEEADFMLRLLWGWEF